MITDDIALEAIKAKKLKYEFISKKDLLDFCIANPQSSLNKIIDKIHYAYIIEGITYFIYHTENQIITNPISKAKCELTPLQESVMVMILELEKSLPMNHPHSDGYKMLLNKFIQARDLFRSCWNDQYMILLD